jgi:L-asparaginase II
MFPRAMDPLQIDVRRGPLVESTHRVSVAVVDENDRLLAAAGAPDLVTYWRSAAKPFQALPLLEDGAADRFGLDDEEIALACASHSSEPMHLAVIDRMLRKIDIAERELACGPHPPISAEVAEDAIRRGVTLTPKWSNCSGKHAGLIAQAKQGGWPIAGYERAGHPVQTAILERVERYTGLSRDQITLAVDGCTTVCFGLPVRAMAGAYARFGLTDRPAARRIWRAMTSHPAMVAGTGRLCTRLMQAWPGEIVAKVGADGVYSAAVPSLRLGLALKVEDGNWHASSVALLEILRQILRHRGGQAGPLERIELLASAINPPVTNTRGVAVGQILVRGELEFFGP